MRVSALCFLLALPFAAPALAAGGNDDAPPTATQTSKDCTKDQIWDEKSKTCTDAKDSRFDDDTRYRAVRELAWAGQPERALQVLATMHEGETDRVLTYLGFAHRKAGRVEEGLAYYEKALQQNPDNRLARSYLGQLYVEMAETDLATVQLAEIRLRGGQGSWPEQALAHAIATGETQNY
ncbi:MAG: tetratricopeptide repeat protein [Rhodobacteraceae bacterium]|nr:tetratricopeptide repeat protein [Paracoccaceae bacterium]